MGGKGHEIDIYREQNQLDAHQNNDDVLPVHEDTKHANREEYRRDDKVMM